MNFNSLQFAIFLPIVFIIYWVVPNRVRWFVLLVASYYFYMSWNAMYGGLLLLVTVLSFSAALIMERAANKNKKKLIMITTISILVSILFVFKYWNFAANKMQKMIATLGIENVRIPISKFILPMGISFYVFQSISYCVDVYRGG